MRFHTLRWRNFLFVALVGALCFGGSFTCKGRSHDNNGSIDSGVPR